MPENGRWDLTGRLKGQYAVGSIYTTSCDIKNSVFFPHIVFTSVLHYSQNEKRIISLTALSD
jgi:hypothetical protein